MLETDNTDDDFMDRLIETNAEFRNLVVQRETEEAVPIEYAPQLLTIPDSTRK